MANLTIRELQEKRLKLELDINALLNKFTEETGYSIEALNMNRQFSQRYHYGTYTNLGYVVGVRVDISTEFKLRNQDLVKTDTWVDEESNTPQGEPSYGELYDRLKRGFEG